MAKRGRKSKSAKAAEIAAAETMTAPAVTEIKQRGRQSQYSDEQKQAFLDAIKNGRRAGASWAEIFDAAKTQGFKGGLPYLKQMGLKSGAVSAKKRGRPTGSKNAGTKVTAKRGRPVGSGKRGRPAGSGGASNGASLGDIESIVARMVKERVAAKMAKAVQALQGAAESLRSLT